MLEFLVALAWVIHTYSGLVFLTNCSLEQMSKGQMPGAVVLAVALAWPLVLIAAITHLSVRAILRN